MNLDSWLRRLSEELRGWHVWRTTGTGSGWYAVPAPNPRPEPIDPRPGWYLHLPDRIGPYYTPQELRRACRDRYGWYDHCDSCGVLARNCGHRGPERDPR